MKNKILLLILISISNVVFSQEAYKSDSALSGLQSEARAMESIGNLESAFDLYGTINERDSSSVFALYGKEKIDSLQPFLKQNFIDQLIGTWKLRKLDSEDSAQQVFTNEIKFTKETVYFYNYKKGKRILIKSYPLNLLPFKFKNNPAIDLGGLGKWYLTLKQTEDNVLGNKFGLFDETRLLITKENPILISSVDQVKPEYKEKYISKVKREATSEFFTYYVKSK